MNVEYPQIGICGLSCRLCPAYHRDTESKCEGCKSESRMKVGCPFITCARKNGIEFCWSCDENTTCGKWRRHREMGRLHDSFVSYQKLEDNISYIQQHGPAAFEKEQKKREQLLDTMLEEFNEGRSKTYFSIATTVFDLEDLEKSLGDARKKSNGLEAKRKAQILHSILDQIADKKRYCLRLRK